MTKQVQPLPGVRGRGDLRKGTAGGDQLGLREAVRAHERAATAPGPERDDEALYLDQWGTSLRLSARRLDDAAEAHRAVGLHERAVALTGDGSPDLPLRRGNLAAALRLHAELAGDRASLERSVEVHEQVRRTVGEESPYTAAVLTNRAAARRASARRTGQRAPLDEAIGTLRRAVRATAPDAPERAGRLSELGHALADRGQVGDASEAVRAYREGCRLAGRPTRRPRRPRTPTRRQAPPRGRSCASNKDPLIIPRGVHFQKALVCSRRLVPHGDHTPAGAAYLACELHQSGAGVFAVLMDFPAQQDQLVQALSLVDDEDLALRVWSGLRFLARHARGRAAAGGHAAVRASIWPVSYDNPAGLVQLWSLGGSPTPLGRQLVITRPVATGTFAPDDLAEDGTPLVAATSVLTPGLIQYFGFSETLQIDSDGVIRTRYWMSQRYGTRVQQWVDEAGVKTTNDVFD
ncbi:hypothetical protein ACFYXF_46410 [Streptomyces sp. NPDC002680]|uniref:hypothetical protein n=1 Tax=Streptomyces sp. NPDC002680 TaxID=3364659 RepID=UPI0036944606